MDLNKQDELHEEFKMLHEHDSEKEIHIHVHIDLDLITDKLDHIQSVVNHINEKENQIMADLSGLQASVANEVTVEQSAITLLQGLSAELAAAGTDPQALADLQAQIDSSSSALAAAVSANTPAAPDDGSGLTGAGNINDGSGTTPNRPGDGSTDTGSTDTGSTDTGSTDTGAGNPTDGGTPDTGTDGSGDGSTTPTDVPSSGV